MVECRKCDGLGTLECPECSEGSYPFFMNEQCNQCNGNLFIPCSECKGKGRVPKEQK